MDPELTRAQAAALLGLSRRFFAARLEVGDIPAHRTDGPEPLVLMSDLLRWHERLLASQREAMRELVNQDDEYEPEVPRLDHGADDIA